ncbi:MAG: Crp/Fnr family transcriptional regulator [Gammaproteobacteria bacterium]|nr:Crp/Fnr family transcriptional regulator [Gammaproteobacteria bacterium]
MKTHYPEEDEPFLRDTNPFDGLECDAVRKLGEIVVEKRLEIGATIFSAKEKAEYVYLIREGRIKLFRITEDGRENVVALLGPGDIFGELTLGKDLTHSVFARVFEPAWLCILTRSGFFRLLAGDPQIALTIVSNIGRRLAAQACSIENLSTYDVDLRLGKLLLFLAAEFGSASAGKADAVELTVNLTHQDLANMIAMCRQTITSIINRFKQAELLRYNGKSLVLNLPRLKQYLAQHGMVVDSRKERDMSLRRQSQTQE